MTTTTGSRWRLDELVRRSRRLLALLPDGEGDSRRVRWQPNERLVRYYTTLGLLDRPAELRGRTAYYRDRHLLQLLAIKTLQARGQSLQAVQARLAGQPDAALAALLGLPPDWLERLDAGERGVAEEALRIAGSQVAEPAPVADAARFWERSPGPTAPSTSSMMAPALPVAELLAVTLAPGARLLIDRGRYPELDVDRLWEAARALRICLRAPRTPEENDDGNA